MRLSNPKYLILLTLTLILIPVITTPGHAGKCLSFDGSNDVAVIPHDSVYNETSFCIEFWFKATRNSLVADGLVWKAIAAGISIHPRIGISIVSLPRDIPDSAPWAVWYAISSAKNYPADYHQSQTETLVQKGTWTHCALVVDSTESFLYLDGVLQASDSAPVGMDLSNNTSSIFLGQTTGDPAVNKFFKGMMDEVRIWNRARTGEEIRKTMGLWLTGNEPGLVGRWGFDEDSGQALLDSSPTENSGVLGFDSGVAGNDAVRVESDLLLGPPLDVTISAEIVPTLPVTDDDLQCLTTLENPTGLEDLVLSYRWYRDSVEIVEGIEVNDEFLTVTGPILSRHYTTKGETYKCLATVGHEDLSMSVMTSEVVIQNSVPTTPVVQIIPRNPRPWDGLSIDIIHPSTDPDTPDDPYSIGYEIRWFRSQDGGKTFAYKAEFSGTAPAGSSIPSQALRDGDVWRVETIPFEKPAVPFKPNTQIARVDGEAGWDQVYIGENNRPEVAVESPGSKDLTAYPDATIVWSAEDIDGDAVTVDLYYDTDDLKGGLSEIALGQPASGSIKWAPPLPIGSPAKADLSGDGIVGALDAFALAEKWRENPAGTRYRIFAIAWDERGAIGEVYSDGEVIVPKEFPATKQGLLELLRSWHTEE